ncbi:MAG: hypothetical protein ACXWMH_00590 [Syntrophales bacterium]
MKLLQIMVSILIMVYVSANATIRYAVEEAYKSLPNYDKNTPFTNADKAQHAKLKQALADTKPSNKECKAGSVLVWKSPGDTSGKDWRVDLSTNICDSKKLLNLKKLIVGLAPTLSIDDMTAWLYDVDGDHENDLIVGYIDVSKDESNYPYLSLWRLKLEQNLYKAYYAGPFLNGTFHAIRSFGNKSKSKTVFVKHASCIECEPTIYLTVLDFDTGTDVHAYEFTYNEKHEGFNPTIEYELPGMGHTVDAKVETRILPPSDTGPHLLQFFDMEEGPDEWWAFTCKDYRCDYQLYKNKPPDNFKKLWDKARRL